MNEVTVSSACKCLGVSTSGYYAWRKRQTNTAQKYNDLKVVYWQHHARLGAPSLVHDMRDLGYSTLDKWIRETNPASSSKRQLSPEQQRILELEKEVKQLREANDVLKKAHVYFLTDHAKKSTR